jgi:hypothetical protein
MSLVAPRVRPRHVPARLGRFLLRMFRPHIYVTYGLLWALALEGSAVLLSGTGTGWSPSRATAVRAASVVLILLFMRMLDEQKDLGYDRVHHPDRPLVTGAITAAELRAAMGVIALLLAALNATVSATSALLVLLDLAYGLALVPLERWSPRVRDGQFASLLAAYPVQLLAGVYLYASLASTGTIEADWRAVPLLLVFACVFLQFELARKTAWAADPGARLYSNVAGPAGSAAMALGLAAGAAALSLVLFRPWQASGGALVAAWLPYLMLALPAYGGWRFLARKAPSGLLGPAMGFVLGFFVSLLVQAAVR